MTDNCTITRYPDSWGIKREPIRPVELRKDYFHGFKFDDNFDWNNLWYDAVQLDQNNILLIGPPLYGTRDILTNHCRFTTTTGEILQFNCIDMDRAGITVIQTQGIQSEIVLHPGDTVIKVNLVSNEFFNRTCLMTLQKDNPISWIKEWILYNRDNLGVDGVLIYDNNSTTYTAEELESAIQTENVLVKVVKWNVPYGPQGFDCNYYNTWDSDYAQSSMFEHAKRRYLSSAKLAINCDIDELIVFKTGDIETAIKNIQLEGIAGYCYRGWWIEPYDIKQNQPADAVKLEDRSFKNYYCTDSRNQIGIGNKWMVIPSLALNYQWSVHHAGAPMRQNNDIWYGHYMPMNTNWSWNRDNYDRDTTGLVVEQQLLANLLKTGIK